MYNTINTLDLQKKSKVWQSDNISKKILEIEEKEKLGTLKFVSFEEGYNNGIKHLKKIFSK